MTLTTDPPAGSAVDLTGCDREPIHIPGAIQPHGLLLVADSRTGVVVAGAGAIEKRLAPCFLGMALGDLLGPAAGARLLEAFAERVAAASDPLIAVDGIVQGIDETFTAVAHRRDGLIVIELEPASPQAHSAVQMLAELESFGRWFEASPQLATLCERGAAAFRQITGFDRVMIYRFLDDGSGRVVAEARGEAVDSFLNHHFPAADIPAQARALYLRSHARAIPDVAYQPAPIRPDAFAGLDLGDTGLRSVSPVHLQYLRHMEVGASASFSIVCDDRLWGLVACHHRTPHLLPRETTLRATALAGMLARQIRTREQAAEYDERLRLREAVDELAGRFVGEDSDEAIFAGVGEVLCHTFGAHGFVRVADSRATAYGVTPTGIELDALVAWAFERTDRDPALQTPALGSLYPAAAQWPELASGLLFLRMPQPGQALMWTRVEQREEIAWAGNPHTAVKTGDARSLTPRASFATWMEAVRGRATPWSREEVDAARHFVRRLVKAQDERDAQRLNRALQRTLAERDALLRQKDLLMREIDHRMLNSLQLVGSYLALQAREAGPGMVANHLEQAQARLAAIGLVHRQLFRSEHSDTVDLRVYLDELLRDLGSALGSDWQRQLTVTLAPILMVGDRAMQVGIVLVELVINASKYAYAGLPGPIGVAVARQGRQVRVTVADEGGGRKPNADAGTIGAKGTGFGSLMVRATVARLGGTLAEDERGRGLRVTLSAPIEAPTA